MPKKPAYPTKACPKCGKLIHAAKQSHEACGWSMNSKTATAAKRSADGAAGVTMEEIQAVKQLVDRIGGAKVQELARVLE